MRGRTLAPRRKPDCGCEWAQITDSFWLCPHDAYGPARNYAGAVQTARVMMELAGGYDAAIARQKARRLKERTAWTG